MYEETKEYIFSEIGKRVKNKKMERGLTYYQLAGYKNKGDYDSSFKEFEEDENEDKQFRYNKLDYSLITNIAGGKPHPQKNPNLVPDVYIECLSEKLGFSSGKELLWGNFEKDSLIQKNIFEKLIIDILWGKEDTQKDVYNDMLFDYIPYAEYHSYWQMFIVRDINMPKFVDGSTYTIPAYYYELREDEIFEQYEVKQKEAINYLWCKFNSDLILIMNNFFNNSFIVKDVEMSLREREEKTLYTLKKLDKKLDVLNKSLKQFFLENKPDENSLGLRVRNLIVSDYKKLGTLISKDVSNERIELGELVKKRLIEASLTYIKELKKLQNIDIKVIKGFDFMINE